jgi:hypothetical protein
MSGEQAFALVPFGVAEPEAGVRLSGRIGRDGERLWVSYGLADPLQRLAIPPLSSAPRRRDELWQATCMELFLALPDQEAYREFNLSPSGDWNVYQLDGYRQGLRPDPGWSALPLRRRDPEPAAAATESEPTGTLELHLTTTLPPELAAAAELEAAVTAVLQEGNGSCSYWALRHPGEQADFHRRDGFALRL